MNQTMQVGDQEGLLRELLSQMANLQKVVEELKLSGKPQGMDVEAEEEVGKEEDEEEPPTWGMLLQPPQVVPEVAEAVSLCLLLPARAASIPIQSKVHYDESNNC